MTVAARVASARHLAGRFVGSLSRTPPPAADEAWVAGLLGPGELAIWRRMSAPDRRHAVGVARRVDAALAAAGSPPAEGWVLPAALLHDCGKVDSGLGTFGRVGATLWAGLRGRPRAAAGEGRVARYLRHPELGASLLREAGGHECTVAWALEHHRPPAAWTVPAELGQILKAADDD